MHFNFLCWVFFCEISMFSIVCHLYAAFSVTFGECFGAFLPRSFDPETGVIFNRGTEVVPCVDPSKESPKCMLSVCFQINFLCFWNVVFWCVSIWVHLLQDVFYSVMFVRVSDLLSESSTSPYFAYKMLQLGSSPINSRKTLETCCYKLCPVCAVHLAHRPKLYIKCFN